MTVTLRKALCHFMRKCIFRVLSVGPLPDHIAFIMDGSRRYARNCKLDEGAGHRDGFLALKKMLLYCYEMQVKYVTVYAFSIDNFKRKPQEVESMMILMEEKLESVLEKENILNALGARLYFVGNLAFLRESVRLAAEKAMAATAKNDKITLLVCFAYTSTDEMVHAVQEACNERRASDRECPIKLVDIERHLYTTMAPEPDILVRTSGESRLSNFLLWQTSYSYLYSPSVLWPDLLLAPVVGSLKLPTGASLFREEKKAIMRMYNTNKSVTSCCFFHINMNTVTIFL